MVMAPDGIFLERKGGRVRMRGWMELIIVLLVPFVSGGLVILSCFAVDVGCAVVVWSSQKKLDESFPPIFFSRAPASHFIAVTRGRAAFLLSKQWKIS